MITVSEVIQDALSEILVQASEAPLEPSEYQSTLRMMNDFMFALEADGVGLGYTAVNDLSDTVTIPDGAIYGLKKNLAVRMAPQFGAVATPELQMQAMDGMRLMEKIAHVVPNVSMPAGVPIGIGNRCGAYSDIFTRDSSE